MNRRPHLLVILAFLYCISPLVYPLLVSIIFGTPLVTVMKETIEGNSWLRTFESFFLPIILGLAIFFARRSSYFIVVIGSFYLVARNLYLFASMSNSLSLSALVALNVFFVFVIIYLFRRDTREIYFNAKMRWWETDPRYVVGWDGSIARLGAQPTKARIRNFAIGGAAIETKEVDFKPHEQVRIEFEYDGKPYSLTAGVVWEGSQNAPEHLIGIQWVDDKKSEAQKMVRELIKTLKSRNVPTTRPPSLWQDFKAWALRQEQDGVGSVD